MHFDDAFRLSAPFEGDVIKRRASAGDVLRTPHNNVLYYSFSLLKEDYSNNEAEYETLIIGLALTLGFTHLHAFDDS